LSNTAALDHQNTQFNKSHHYPTIYPSLHHPQAGGFHQMKPITNFSVSIVPFNKQLKVFPGDQQSY